MRLVRDGLVREITVTFALDANFLARIGLCHRKTSTGGGYHASLRQD